MSLSLFILQGAVEAVGTFTHLQGSGQLDCAKQLDLEMVEGKEENLNMMSVRLPLHCNAEDSVNKWQRQDSESSPVVRWLAVAIKTFPLRRDGHKSYIWWVIMKNLSWVKNTRDDVHDDRMFAVSD